MTYEDPTSKGDRIAAEMRAFYEANRPRWWQWRERKRWKITADNLMLGLLFIAERGLKD